jgi:4-amino-4-deoxy-L-arabinose transferase-like glycosyltransferase
MKTSTTRAGFASLARARHFSGSPLLLVLLLALVLRLLLWGHVPRTGLISDEGEYLSAASWLAQGRGFSWYQGYLWTRAPLYPLFVAAHLRLFGDTSAPIYLTQTLLSLANVALVYLLAQRVLAGVGRAAGEQRGWLIPTIAAGLMAVYFPFALYAQVLLSETLFITLLLGGFLALAAWAEAGPKTNDGGPKIEDRGDWERKLLVFGPWSLVVAGVLFGLATLTRSLTLPFLPLAAVWIAVVAGQATRWWRPARRGLVAAAVFLVCAGAVVLPWTIYNSVRLYGGAIAVDTTGAFNLMLGARTAYDGKREDAPSRNFMLALLGRGLSREQRLSLLGPQPAAGGRTLDASCLLRRGDARLLAALDALDRPDGQLSQATRQNLMTAEGLCLIAARPIGFVGKSLAELVDLFKINYGGDERFADSFVLGRLPRWYAVSLFLLDDTLYVLALPLAVVGFALARRMTKDERPTTKGILPTQPLVFGLWPSVVLVGLWLLYNIAVAPLLFAINRFRLPLLPFAFIFAAYALARLPRAGWRGLRWGYGVIAVALLLVAATPYAYLEPRAQGAAATWASYLGPYPSSVASTAMAWQARPGYLLGQRVQAALGAGDAGGASALLRAGDVPTYTLRLARPLLAGLEGRPEGGLALLPPLGTITRTKDVELAVVRGDLQRRAGDLAGARFVLGETFVDSANPVQFAWTWLHPPPLPDNRIDVAGNLDLGYIAGCYLGEGDPAAGGNFRWCTDGAMLRFPQAGTGAPQALVLRVDGRGWAGSADTAPPVRVVVDGQEVGSFTPDIAGPRELTVALPPSPPGADVVVTLRTPTFVAPPERYLSQQGKGIVGQVQRLGVRIDWAELRGGGE